MEKFENNTIAKIIYIMAIIVLLGGITASLILAAVFKVEHSGYYYSYDEYNALLAVCGSVSSIFVSILLFALSEIIYLLQRILDDTTNQLKNNHYETLNEIKSLHFSLKDKDVGKEKE